MKFPIEKFLSKEGIDYLNNTEFKKGNVLVKPFPVHFSKSNLEIPGEVSVKFRGVVYAKGNNVNLEVGDIIQWARIAPAHQIAIEAFDDSKNGKKGIDKLHSGRFIMMKEEDILFVDKNYTEFDPNLD